MNNRPRVLIIYFSLSGQSRSLINLFAEGLREEKVDVSIEQLKAVERISFPFKGICQTGAMMLSTLFRKRTTIQRIAAHCFEKYHLIVLAGPTWSYNSVWWVDSLSGGFGFYVLSLLSF
ncbi:MAG: hypothetical protein CSA26_08915 [Desulfobacterales bacterium]|nr:MAG: hypothetical protein CSA26_08915 [Desulfobacterales bacterium]